MLLSENHFRGMLLKKKGVFCLLSMLKNRMQFWLWQMCKKVTAVLPFEKEGKHRHSWSEEVGAYLPSFNTTLVVSLAAE